jgi:uncharacterized glyoxalase superfamily protein PhnB
MTTPTQNPPPGWPRLSTALVYEDEETAIDWLSKAFGFEPRVIVKDGDGNIMHSELEYEGAVIMIMKASSRPGATAPNQIDGRFTQSLYVFVPDIDTHCARARAAGAEITQEPETKDYGDRGYTCIDCGGHVWFFGQRVDQAKWDESITEFTVES